MMPTDRDLERLVRAACSPVPPSPRLRAQVLARAARPRKAGRVLRLVLPYAAGIVTAIAAQRVVAGTGVAGGGDVPAYAQPAAAGSGIGFESIADRPPLAPPPAPETSAPEREESPIVVAYAPVPRIS